MPIISSYTDDFFSYLNKFSYVALRGHILKVIGFVRTLFIFRLYALLLIVNF